MPSGVKDIQILELKDTISQLNKTISTQNELISSLQKMLEERNAKDSEKDLLIANLQSQLAYLKNKVFGSTSEIRHDQLDGQLNLFGTPVSDEKPAEVIEPEVISVSSEFLKERYMSKMEAISATAMTPGRVSSRMIKCRCSVRSSSRFVSR